MAHSHDVLLRPSRHHEVTTAITFLGRRRRVYDGLVALGDASPGDRVLDVGCGTGYLTRRAARAVAPGGHVTGIDPSAPVIEHATGRSPANCTFQTAGVQDLPFDEGSFDLVISSLALHHVTPGDRPAAFAEMRRVLRPGGRLLIADFAGRPRHLPPLSRFAKRHDAAVDLSALARDAGLRVTGTGDRWPALRYVRAERP